MLLGPACGTKAMSDIFLSAGIEVDAALVARELRFTDYTKVESGSAAGLTWALSRVDDLGLWGPAWDQASQTRVLIGGRIALEHPGRKVDHVSTITRAKVLPTLPVIE